MRSLIHRGKRFSDDLLKLLRIKCEKESWGMSAGLMSAFIWMVVLKGATSLQCLKCFTENAVTCGQVQKLITCPAETNTCATALILIRESGSNGTTLKSSFRKMCVLSATLKCERYCHLQRIMGNQCSVRCCRTNRCNEDVTLESSTNSSRNLRGFIAVIIGAGLVVAWLTT